MKIANLFEVKGFSAQKIQLFGVECEVESLAWDQIAKMPPTIQVHEDGSLRNNGREFVSSPQSLEDTMVSFEQLHKLLVYQHPEQAFSSRTSIHVHMNCQPLDETVVKRIMLFYALFEEVFFELVEPSRRNNIHCVALTETALPDRYGMSLANLHSSWSKYTALNLLPLSNLGTIEFRHMQGHNDPKVLREWLTVLDRLFHLASNTELTGKTLTRNNMVSWFAFLFGHTQRFQELLSRLDLFTENTIIDVKMGLL